MAIAKTNLFDNKLNSTSALFKALAHPARLAILRYLAGTRVCITGDISDELPLSRTTVNQHLKELRKAGLIQGTVEGVRVNYCLNPKKIREMIRIANCFFAEVDLEHEYRCGMKILILCTGNSCRSQMAEGFLRSFDNRLEVFSAGTHPAPRPNPNAVEVMKEVGIDISGNMPKNVNLFIHDPFDYVITVCGGARDICPVFTGTVAHRLHIGFDDPADAIGKPQEVLQVYRRVRDQIRETFWDLYRQKIANNP